MDTYDFFADPRTLSMAERHEARRTHQHGQQTWLPRLRRLAEAPLPADDFPAFLLDTRPFSELAEQLLCAETRQQLPTEIADELDWFVRAFADYLRTCEGEDVFPDSDSRAG